MPIETSVKNHIGTITLNDRKTLNYMNAPPLTLICWPVM
jgi:enoyl-CoA hydratase/carnithine racemase